MRDQHRQWQLPLLHLPAILQPQWRGVRYTRNPCCRCCPAVASLRAELISGGSGLFLCRAAPMAVPVSPFSGFNGAIACYPWSTVAAAADQILHPGGSLPVRISHVSGTCNYIREHWNWRSLIISSLATNCHLLVVADSTNFTSNQQELPPFPWESFAILRNVKVKGASFGETMIRSCSRISYWMKVPTWNCVVWVVDTP